LFASGAISFITELYGGSISDKKLTQLSGLLDSLEPGDESWQRKYGGCHHGGFTIDDILPSGMTLNVPPHINAIAFFMPCQTVTL